MEDEMTRQNAADILKDLNTSYFQSDVPGEWDMVNKALDLAIAILEGRG